MNYSHYTQSPIHADSAFVEPTAQMPYSVLTEDAKKAVSDHSKVTGISEQELFDGLYNLAAWAYC